MIEIKVTKGALRLEAKSAGAELLLDVRFETRHEVPGTPVPVVYLRDGPDEGAIDAEGAALLRKTICWLVQQMDKAVLVEAVVLVLPDWFVASTDDDAVRVIRRAEWPSLLREGAGEVKFVLPEPTGS